MGRTPVWDKRTFCPVGHREQRLWHAAEGGWACSGLCPWKKAVRQQALQCGWTPKAASAGEGPESQTLIMKVRKITAAFLDPMATILRKKLNPEPENAW